MPYVMVVSIHNHRYSCWYNLHIEKESHSTINNALERPVRQAGLEVALGERHVRDQLPVLGENHVRLFRLGHVVYIWRAVENTQDGIQIA